MADLRAAVDELDNSFKAMTGGVGGTAGAMQVFGEAVVDTAKALAWMLDIVNGLVEGTEKLFTPLYDLAHGRLDRAVAGFRDIGVVGNPHRDEVDKLDDDQADAETREISAQWREINAERRMNGARDRLFQRTGAIRQQRAFDAGTFTGPPAAIPSEGSLLPATAPPAYLLRPSVAAEPSGPPMAAPVIHQTNHTNVDVHTSSDAPKEIGAAVGQGVATSQQRSNERAFRAARKP